MGYSGKDIRLYLLKQHYRKPVPFDIDLLDEAKRIRARFNNFVHHEMAGRPVGFENSAITADVEGAQAVFRAALEDDINTSKALAGLHDLMSAVNRQEPTRADAERVVAFLREVDTVFSMLDDAPDDLEEDIERLIAERNTARAAKDFARADQIRDQLLSRGIELLDTPQGTRWKQT